jgi:hypothetical protein
MAFMTDKKLLDNLSKLGFPMFEPSEEMDVNETLAEVVKSNDTRLWEGFPVLLKNASESYLFSQDRVNRLLKTQLSQRPKRRNASKLGANFKKYRLEVASVVEISPESVP